jgi:hypothetical protein
MYTHFMRGDWERALASDTDTLKWVTHWTLPLVGRHDEAIAAYREMESRALPGRIRELMRASRLALEGQKEEGMKVVESFWQRDFDPEGLYFTARVLAKLGESDASLKMLNRVIDGGFYCATAMLRDPWLDSVRGTSAFYEIIQRASALSHDAEDEFRRLGGEKILL